MSVLSLEILLGRRRTCAEIIVHEMVIGNGANFYKKMCTLVMCLVGIIRAAGKLNVEVGVGTVAEFHSSTSSPKRALSALFVSLESL